MQNVTNFLIYHLSNFYFQGWAAHCLELLLEDWGEKTWVKQIVKRVKVIVSFIWQHHAPLAIFYHYETNLVPQNPIETQFATNFLMIEWLLKVRPIVQQTIKCWHGRVD